ncbi:MAG: response regulator [Eubacteriales bacterium]|nr:response regulator [Eubacteriales bacterium]
MTLMMVDDDIEMLESLQGLIDWQALGYTEILTAINGREALDKSSGKVIDLLISDIGMPMVDGYELVDRLHAVQPDMACIFLTCHEDFTHAKKAIAVGTDDYLVKYTLTPEVMLAAVEQVHEKRRKKEETDRQAEASVASMQVIQNSYKEKLLFALADGRKIDVLAHERQMKAMHITRPSSIFRVVGFYMDYDEARLQAEEAEHIRQWRYEAVNNIGDMLRQRHCPDEVFPFDSFILLVHEGHMLGKMYVELLQQIAAMANETMRVHVSLCVSSPCTDFWQIGKQLGELTAQRDNGFYGDDTFETDCSPRAFVGMPYSLFNDACARQRNAMSDEVSFWASSDRIAREMMDGRYEPHMVRKLYRVFLSNITRLCQQSGFFTEEIDISGMSFRFCCDAVAYRYQWLLEQRGERVQAVQSPDVNAVLAYIEGHLDQKISLQAAADAIYKNSSYLSRLFKQTVGVSFSDYLIQARIQKATQLLEQTDLPVEEVALRVGIENLSYFYKFYKRETGRTPRSSR